MSVSVRYADPRCIIWAKATASLWGHDDDHDLDEPVRLTNEVPCRLRYRMHSEGGEIICDRSLSMKTIRCGRNVTVRFYFSGGTYFETEVAGAREITPSATWADVNIGDEN